MLSATPGDLGERAVVERLALPDPGAVHVHGDAERRGPLVDSAVRSSHAGSRQPASRRGSSSSTAAEAGARAGRRSSTVGSDAAGRQVLELGSRAAAAARRPRARAGGTARGSPTRSEPARSQCTRSAACWAMIPLGNIAAAGLPSSSATSSSSRATAPRSAYTSHWSIPSSSAARATSVIASTGVRRGVQKTSSSHCRATSRNRSIVSFTSSILVPGGTPSSTASTISWRAVRATRCGIGAEAQPGDAELLEPTGRRHARRADQGEPAAGRTPRRGSRPRSRRAGRARTRPVRRPRGRPGRAAIASSSTSRRSWSPARTNASVRALSTKSGTPSARRRRAPRRPPRPPRRAASSGPRGWRPTTPRPTARRMVSAGSPYPASRSAVTGRSTAAAIRPTISSIRSTGMCSPSG